MLSWAKIPRTVPALANAPVWTAFLPACVLLIVIGLADNSAVGGVVGLELLLQPQHPATLMARVAQ